MALGQLAAAAALLLALAPGVAANFQGEGEPLQFPIRISAERLAEYNPLGRLSLCTCVLGHF